MKLVKCVRKSPPLVGEEQGGVRVESTSKQYMTHADLFSNRPDYNYRRKKLRRNATMAERVLWKELKGKRIVHKFRRQFQIGKYIVDFCCVPLRLIIELDGPIHDEQKDYDKHRQQWIELQKYTVIRFKNDEVIFDRAMVMQKIFDVTGKIIQKRKILSQD
jgi:very-short-patch-repair endonuclease